MSTLSTGMLVKDKKYYSTDNTNSSEEIVFITYHVLSVDETMHNKEKDSTLTQQHDLATKSMGPSHL